MSPSPDWLGIMNIWCHIFQRARKRMTSRLRESKIWVMRILLIVLLLTLAVNQNAYAVEGDKAMHAAVSAVGTMGLYLYYQKILKVKKSPSLLTSFLVMQGLGALKELIIDHPAGDMGDLGANLAGSVLSGAVIFVWEF